MANEYFGEPRNEPTVIDSMRDPSAMTTSRTKIDAKDSLVLIEPQAQPFTVLTRAVRGTRTVTQYKYDLFEKDPHIRLSQVSGAVTSGAVTVNVKSGQGTRFRKYQLVQNSRTREVFWVSAISTDALTVTRQIGGTGPAAMVDGDNLVLMGEAHEDGGNLGTLISTKEVNVYNYTQIFKKGIGWSGRQLHTDFYGGKDKTSERRAQAIEFKKEIEFSAFFGQRHTMTGSNSRLVTMSGGFEFFANKTNWDLQGNEPTENAFMEFLEYIMREGNGGRLYGKGMKWLFAPPRLLTIIERWARDRIRVVDALSGGNTSTSKMAKGLGVRMAVSEFRSTHGKLMLVEAPILAHGNNDRALVVDLEHVQQVVHQGRDIRLLENQEANDDDAEKEQWFGDVGWDIENANAHGWITNIPQ